MSATELGGDRWSGSQSISWVIEAPSLTDLEAALGRLDGATYTQLYLDSVVDGQSWTLIVGGDAGRYVVTAQRDDEEFWYLQRPNAPEGTVLLTTGGQEGEFPSDQVVPTEAALAAARVFFSTGRLDPAQTWVSI